MIKKALLCKVLIVFVVFIMHDLHYTKGIAQVTIGSSIEPNKGSLLDLKETDSTGVNSSKGLLLPRMNLSSLTSMEPIFKDSELNDDVKKTHIGLTIFNLKEDYSIGLCKGVYVWTMDLSWLRLPKPCCLALDEVEISNDVLNFLEGDSPKFIAEVIPKEASIPIIYEWYLDNQLISSGENNFVTFPIERAHDGKDIYVIAFNRCKTSKVISVKKTILVDIQCDPVESVEITHTDFNFINGQKIELNAAILPLDPTSPVTFDWYLDGELIASIIDDNELSLLIDLSYDGKTIQVKASNCDQIPVESSIKTFNVCNPVKSVNIANSLNNTDFEFAENKNVLFSAVLFPEDSSEPMAYIWELSGEEEPIGYEKNLPLIIKKNYNGKKMMVTASNSCGKTVSLEKTITIIECPDIDGTRIKQEGKGDSSMGFESITFTITELEKYTEEQLEALGITIHWYYANNAFGTSPTLKLLEGENKAKFVFNAIDYYPGGQAIGKLAFTITGAEDVMNCPMSAGKSNGWFQLTLKDFGNGNIGSAQPRYISSDWTISQ